MADPAPKTLFLVDGAALAYRSHFAFIRNPLVTKRGEIVSAVFGFTSTLLRILERERPSHWAVIFDTSAPTFRHERYPDYKATRQKMPDELVSQLPSLRAVVAALNMAWIEQDGLEADDLIAALSLRAAADGFLVRIVSGDKDFCQLVTPKIALYALPKGEGEPEMTGPDEVPARLGVRAEQVVDYLALMGDASDNVPGVPKVGEKTARELLAQFGSLDQLYARLAEVSKPALQKNLAEHRADAELSRDLVRLSGDHDPRVTLAQLERQPPDPVATRELFQRFEFQSLIERIPDAGAAPAAAARNYRVVRGGSELRAALAELRHARIVVVDTETTGLDPRRAELVGISLCGQEGRACYIPFREPGSGLFAAASGKSGIERDEAFAELKALLADPTVRKAGQNSKYDQHILERAGLPLAGLAFDTMVAHYCVAPGAPSHGLDALALQYFKFVKIKTSELIGSGKKQITMDQVDVAKVGEYACEDADYTFRLIAPLEAELAAGKVDSLFAELELPLIDVLRRMEAAGVALDVAALADLTGRCHLRGEELEKQIHVLAGEPFNVKSPQQLAGILYEKLKVHEQLGIKKVPRTETGFSTNAEFLETMEEHPLVAAVLEYRQVEKLRSTYLETLPKLVHPQTGRLHTSFNQAVAATGRLSSSDPNLQNIPIRTPLGREIRRAFISSFAGGTLLSADYSQVELRLLAHLADDEQLRAAFAAGEDVHRRTASLVFGVPIGEVTTELRTRAKAINFGIIYGMGAQRLARETGLKFGEAQAFIERYFGVFAGVRRWLDATVEQARKTGSVSTLLGRTRAIPEIQSEDPRIQANARNVAVNTPIQGTAADLIKRAMLAVDRELAAAKLSSRMILQVHDELVFDVAPGESDAVRALARRCMEGALDLSVRLQVDIGEGATWLDAH
ncbi:MAG: DNA polymerase I [Planctomycetes bacterium]|nr:DNA polymerase I [Planctomycetota bacterium]